MKKSKLCSHCKHPEHSKEDCRERVCDAAGDIDWCSCNQGSLMVKRIKTGWLIMVPEWMPSEQWQAYIEMRKKIKRPLTEYAAVLAIKKLDNLRKAGHDPKEVLEQSIFNSYWGLFEVKTNGQFTSKADQRNASISDTTRKVFGGNRQLPGNNAKGLPDKTSGK